MQRLVRIDPRGIGGAQCKPKIKAKATLRVSLEMSSRMSATYGLLCMGNFGMIRFLGLLDLS